MSPNGRIGMGAEDALAAGENPPVGRYRFDLTTGRWRWSDAVFRIYGFEPGDVVPTTELMLAHELAEDRARVHDVLAGAIGTGEPFSSVHRIRDARGCIRTLAVTGQGRRDSASGEVVELIGFVVDLTAVQHTTAQREATRSIRAAARRRATIDQAQGVLMVAYRIGPRQAADLLERAAANLQVSPATLGAQLVAWFSHRGAATSAPTTALIDEFLESPARVRPTAANTTTFAP